MIKHSLSLALAATLSAAGACQAAFMVPDWTRGSAYTTYQQWEIFTAPAGPNAPDVAGAFNPNGTANARDASGASFITSGGNIYSFSGPIQVKVAVPEHDLGGDYDTTSLFQTRTQGTESVYSATRVTAVYADGSTAGPFAPVERAELFRESLGGFGGGLVDYAYVFNVPGNPDSLLFEVDAAGSSMSLDRASVDTIVTRADAGSALLAGMNGSVGFVAQSVPEPGAIGAALVVGLVAMGRRRRRA